MLKTYSAAKGEVPADNIWFLRVDRDDPNFLWMAHSIGPVVNGKVMGYDREAEKWWRATDRPGPKQSVSTVLVDRQGRVWTSDPTHAFLVREGGQWRSIPPSKNGPGGTRYRCGYQGRDGRLYFGGDAYYSGGICLTVLAP